MSRFAVTALASCLASGLLIIATSSAHGAAITGYPKVDGEANANAEAGTPDSNSYGPLAAPAFGTASATDFEFGAGLLPSSASAGSFATTGGVYRVDASGGGNFDADARATHITGIVNDTGVDQNVVYNYNIFGGTLFAGCEFGNGDSCALAGDAWTELTISLMVGDTVGVDGLLAGGTTVRTQTTTVEYDMGATVTQTGTHDFLMGTDDSGGTFAEYNWNFSSQSLDLGVLGIGAEIYVQYEAAVTVNGVTSVLDNPCAFLNEQEGPLGLSNVSNGLPTTLLAGTLGPAASGMLAALHGMPEAHAGVPLGDSPCFVAFGGFGDPITTSLTGTTMTPVPPTGVPAPVPLALIGLGLVGLATLRLRRR